MPGMNSGIKASHPTVAAAFEAALRQQAIIVLLTFAALGLAWLAAQAWLTRAAAGDAAPQAPGSQAPGSGVAAAAEPAGRRLIRIGFGLLWLFDGVLQAQPKLAAGLPAQVIGPVAASSPHWVQQLADWAGTVWSHHPVPAATAAVWIEVGIGTWMLVAARGPWSRLAGLASLGWGLAVWVFGESFGGIFVPGLSWLTGAPGAALSYAVAGALIALPGRAWHTARLGRLTLAGMGLFLTGTAVLQAWPGRGFWQGTFHGRPGTLTGMVQSMATIPQPRFLSAWVAGFGSFNAAHGFAVNLAVVAVLALAGAVLLSGRRRLIRPALIAVLVLCLADWVLVEDLGFFGGLGTDPNSMPPFALLAMAGYLALASGPVAAAEPAGTGTPVGWLVDATLLTGAIQVAGAVVRLRRTGRDYGAPRPAARRRRRRWRALSSGTLRRGQRRARRWPILASGRHAPRLPRLSGQFLHDDKDGLHSITGSECAAKGHRTRWGADGISHVFRRHLCGYLCGPAAAATPGHCGPHTDHRSGTPIAGPARGPRACSPARARIARCVCCTGRFGVRSPRPRLPDGQAALPHPRRIQGDRADHRRRP